MRKSIISFLATGILAMTYLTDCGKSRQNIAVQNHDTIPLIKHWEKAIPYQEIPEGLVSISAKSCSTCHQDIYNEWAQSTHAVAFQDMQFQTEMKKDGVLTCLNCHTPLQNQQEFIIKGLINGDYKTPWKIPNPLFDKELQLESITCATCHVRDGNVIGAIGNTNSPHKTVKDVDFLSEKLCVSCHNVVDELSAVLVCTFETGDEWDGEWAAKNGKTCITCHMPETERSLFPEMEKRKSHFHNFPGSGISKYYGQEVERLVGLEIDADSLKKSYMAGEEIKYSLILKNSYAGHKVPTGDPERFFLIVFKVLDNEGNILDEKQYRIGEVWEWHPVAKKISDNNLDPLEEREYSFVYKIPDRNDLSLVVELSKHRMTKENAKYNGIFEQYPLSIMVFQRSYPIDLKNI